MGGWKRGKQFVLSEKATMRFTYVWLELYDTLEKGKTMETVRTSVVARDSEEEGKDEGVEHRGFSRQGNYSAWYCNDEYMSLHIFPKHAESTT